MSRVYVGNLKPIVNEKDLEDQFRVYGVIRSIWVARKPPGYAFIDFDDHMDAQDAIHKMDGKNGWRVELSYNSKGGGGGGRGGGRGRDSYGSSDTKCYECGKSGHFARECRLRIGPGGLGSGCRRSRSPPRYRSSPSYGRRSYSPRDQSPRQRGYSRSSPPGRSYSRSPPRKNSYNRSPLPRGRSYSRSPHYANGSGGGGGRH